MINRRIVSYALGRRTYATNARNVINELSSRGLIAQSTSTSLSQVCQNPLTVYCGIDPTASSLHIGNLLPLITLLHFQLHGHRPIALIGGATGFIGDPSGRATERKLLDVSELERNVELISAQVQQFFNVAGEYSEKRRIEAATSPAISPPEVVNNFDWFRNVTLLDFLRSSGKHAKVNTMLTRDSVSSRLNGSQGISFTEFTYQLLQAEDFHYLYKNYGCRLQIGGSDQWGNIISGIDLIRRRRQPLDIETTGDNQSLPSDGESPIPTPFEPESGEDAYGLTIPLLTTPSGEKFGKSAGNAVWLDRNLTSVFDFYQYFMRVPDSMVGSLMAMFTLLPSYRISDVLRRHQSDPSERRAQRTLAAEVTELVHGVDGVRHAEAATRALFDSRSASSDVDADDVVLALEGDPRLVRVTRQDAWGKPLTSLMKAYGNGVTSRAHVERTLKAGGFYLNNVQVTDPRQTLKPEDGRIAVLRMGSTNHLVLAMVGAEGL
ncbi:tyrosyl-tRNA synthetase [Tulasnella sp. 330]|nr:tyrosyl-tRNA synthetase [Tulasnella sp. 330]